MSVPQFTIKRTFDATREQVWRAWTDPELAALWWHPHQVTTPPESLSIDLREGGRYAYLMIAPDGSKFPTAGTYLEIREPERLQFTWGRPEDADDEAPVITVDLVETADGRCEMTFQVRGIGDDRSADDSTYQGWTEAFEELDAALAECA
jgi:uncharacterized protein YndB with AHSA1/START domain